MKLHSLTLKTLLSLVAIALFGLAAGQTAEAQSARRPAVVAKPSPVQQSLQIPPAEALVTLSRSILVALAQANSTNNYSVLYQISAMDFQRENTPQSLSATFASFRANNMDISPVAVIPPQFLMSPEIRDQKLRLLGRFPSQPLGVNFDLTFVPENGRWKLRGLSVNLSQ